MPLFTVANSTNTSRVLVCKDTVKAVIATAKEKLHLEGEEFKIVLARNGAEIDEDELLLALPPGSDVVLLSSNASWPGENPQPQPSQQTQPLHQSHQTPQQTPISTQHNSTANALMNTPSRPLLSLPAHVLKDFEEHLDAGKRLTPMEQKLLIHSIAHHMTLHGDYSRTTCDRFAKSLTSRYPVAFEIRDADNNFINNGRVSFLNRLYERLCTVKPKSLIRKRVRREIESEREGEVDDLIVRERWIYEVSEKHDSYGCVAWEPELPEDEDNETQEEKRSKLIKLDQEIRMNDIMNLMKSTYPTQRRAINRRRGALKLVLEEWKYLTHPDYFLWHSTLLGKEVTPVWQASLESKILPLHNLLKFNLLTKKVTGPTKTAFAKAQSVLDEGDTASLDLRMDTPRIVSIFPAVLHYFKEDTAFVYKVIDEFTTDVEMQETNGQVDRPLLLIKGNLFAEETLTYIVCEGQIIHKKLTPLNGFLFLFLSYYVFNYRYNDQTRGFMEFIQRMLLVINPTVSGHKRGPKAPRRSDLDPRVKKLTAHLANHLQNN